MLILTVQTQMIRCKSKTPINCLTVKRSNRSKLNPLHYKIFPKLSRLITPKPKSQLCRVSLEMRLAPSLKNGWTHALIKTL